LIRRRGKALAKLTGAAARQPALDDSLRDAELDRQ
jgi:hypothetical protein